MLRLRLVWPLLAGRRKSRRCRPRRRSCPTSASTSRPRASIPSTCQTLEIGAVIGTTGRSPSTSCRLSPAGLPRESTVAALRVGDEREPAEAIANPVPPEPWWLGVLQARTKWPTVRGLAQSLRPGPDALAPGRQELRQLRLAISETASRLQQVVKFRHRILDPAILFWRPWTTSGCQTARPATSGPGWTAK